jgi:glutamate racemase
MAATSQQAIGIFDSGIGGLTVLREIRKLLPHEQIKYLGDTARVPYGTRSAQTVQKYARANTEFLNRQDIKLLVIACNTASAVATEQLRGAYSLPVIDVVGPGARAAVEATSSGRVGIIGTEGTISSGAYQREISALVPEAVIFAQACPLFVPLVEQNWVDADDPVVQMIVRRYLEPFLDFRIDTLVLGCTHYPLLKQAIARFLGASILLIDSAEQTAREVQTTLREASLLRRDPGGPPQYFVTDIPHRFAATGSLFLGESLGDVQLVDIM